MLETDLDAGLSGLYRGRMVEHVLYGPGSIARWREIPALQSTHAILLTTPSVARSPLFARLASLFAPILAATFKDARQHAPVSVVERVLEAISEAGAETVITVGGGSVIDTAKAAIDQFASSGQYLPHVAVPTTLSAAEFAPSYGVTEDETRRKRRGSHPALLPRGVILDAELTRLTPDWLWLGSGLRAVDHAVEIVYAPDHNPVADALALDAIRLLFRFLPASVPAEEHTGERQHCQIGAWLSFAANSTITFGPSHRLGRLIGPLYNVPHGFTSAILLPHVMDALLKRTNERQMLIARAAQEGLGEPGPARPEDAAVLVRDLVRRLGLPTRLRDVGVPREDLPGLVGDGADVGLEPASMLHLLQAAW